MALCRPGIRREVPHVIPIWAGELSRLTVRLIICWEIMLCIQRRNRYKRFLLTVEPADMEFKESIWQEKAKRNRRQFRMSLFKK